MSKKTPLFLAGMVAVVAISGCTMIPDLSLPQAPVALQWEDVPGYRAPVGDEVAARMAWKEFFNSPELHQVIGTALENNKDLKIAALNIDEARTVYRVSRADLMPTVNANAGATYTGTSDESSPTGNGQDNELYEANIGLGSYEIDLFGKIRSRNESAINEYFATEEAAAVVRNALIAETANAYVQLLADQKLLNLTRKTLEAQKKTHSLLSESLKNGVATEQDVARAATAVETAQVNLHQYTRFVAQDRNALFLLMGVAQDQAALPDTTMDDVVIRDNIGVGLPSEALLMRPDIRQAEYELMARNADIGAARAMFFPSISLTGAYGLASESLSKLFSSGAAGAWSFIPQITLPIFEGGRNKANLDLAAIRKEKAVIQYEKAIQTAFREVSDELAARATLDEQLKAQHRLVSAAQKVYDLSKARYEYGVDSFLSVLDAQRELYVYQQNEIQIERQRLSNLVDLYKALGGGVM